MHATMCVGLLVRVKKEYAFFNGQPEFFTLYDDPDDLGSDLTGELDAKHVAIIVEGPYMNKYGHYMIKILGTTGLGWVQATFLEVVP